MKDRIKNWVLYNSGLYNQHRHRLLSEMGDFLKLSPSEVYHIGRDYLKGKDCQAQYNDPRILCRYIYVGVEPNIRTYNNLYAYVEHGKLLDYGSGVGLQFDPIRNNANYELYLLDIPGPAFDFVKYKYRNAHFIEAPTRDIGSDYSLVSITDVLEHVENPLDVTVDVLAALKQGGCLLYHFNENPNKPGHLIESIRQKPKCDALVKSCCEYVCNIGQRAQYQLWRKM